MRATWALVQHHKWDYEGVMGMVAWERQVYAMMTMMYVKEENDRIKNERQAKR